MVGLFFYFGIFSRGEEGGGGTEGGTGCAGVVVRFVGCGRWEVGSCYTRVLLVH